MFALYLNGLDALVPTVPLLAYDLGTMLLLCGVDARFFQCSLMISLPLGIAFGMLAAVKKNTWVDYLVSFMVVLGISVPSFVFGTLLQYFIGFKMGLFPIIFDTQAVGLAKLYSLVLPIAALALSPISRVTRYLRAELAETLNSDLMLLARP